MSEPIARERNWTPSDLEDAIIASFFLTPNDTVERGIACGITADSFTGLLHRKAFEGILKLRKQGLGIDEVVLYELWMREDEARAQADCASLMHIINRIEVVSNFPAWVNLHLRKYRDRIRCAAIETASALARDKGPEEAERFLTRRFAEIAEVGGEYAEGNDEGAIERAIADAHRQREGKGPIRFVEIPLPSWDQIFYPIEKHELVVIGARPSVGKSSFAVQTLAANLWARRRVVLFTLETDAESVLERLAGQVAQVNICRLQDEPEDKFVKYVTTLERLKGLDGDLMHILSGDRLPAMELAASRAQTIAGPIDLIFVDYLQLVEVENRGRENRTVELGEVTRRLKKWTGPEIFGCPVVALSQLNRESEKSDRMPRLSDLRESGSIEQDADRVVFIHRPNEDRNGRNQANEPIQDYLLIQAKLRSGPLGHLACQFRRLTTTFFETDKEAESITPQPDAKRPFG